MNSKGGALRLPLVQRDTRRSQIHLVPETPDIDKVFNCFIKHLSWSNTQSLDKTSDTRWRRRHVFIWSPSSAISVHLPRVVRETEMAAVDTRYQHILLCMFILPLGGAVHSIPSAAQLYRVSDLMGHQTLSAHGDCHWRLPVWQLLIGSGALVVVQNFLASHRYDDSWWCHWTHICKTNSTFNACSVPNIVYLLYLHFVQRKDILMNFHCNLLCLFFCNLHFSVHLSRVSFGGYISGRMLQLRGGLQVRCRLTTMTEVNILMSMEC